MKWKNTYGHKLIDIYNKYKEQKGIDLPLLTKQYIATTNEISVLDYARKFDYLAEVLLIAEEYYTKQPVCDYIRFKLSLPKQGENYYVYQHIDKFGKCIYIGKSKRLSSRQAQHRSNSTHFNEVKTILISSCSNDTVMRIYELYYINKLKPKYNVEYNHGDSIEALKGIPELKFKKYTPTWEKR